MEIPTGQNVIATLPIAALKDSQERRTGEGMGRLRDVEHHREDAATAVRLPRAVSRRRRPGRRAPSGAVVVIAVAGLARVLRRARSPGCVQRAPWASVWSILTDADVSTALRLSLECSLGATGARRSLFGLPIAWLLARTEFRGKAIVRAFAILPMVLPPVVGGVALLFSFGRQGPRRPVPRPLVRHHAAVHDEGRDPRRDVRRDAVPRDHGRGRAARPRHPVRRRGREPRREPVDGAAAHHAARDRAVARGGRRAHVGAGTRRVRRDDHVRRATSRGRRRRCRSRCTSRSRTTRASRSCSASCCSRCRSPCWPLVGRRVFGARPIAVAAT